MNRASFYAAVLLALFPAQFVLSQNPAQSPPPSQAPGSPAVPTIRITSRLVFLDVTVIDRSGHPVVTGLTKNDFSITEDKKPQRIFSFEPPEVHTINLHAGAENSDGNAPRMILVLDFLNSRFQDFAYIRYEVRRFLNSQPSQLPYPTELMLVGNESLDMLVSYTRDREELLDAVAHLPPALPYKEMQGSFWVERLAQSIDALQQIALQSKGVPGRKNIVWIGRGMPSIDPATYDEPDTEIIQQYLHVTTNLLVDSRISLFVLYPGLHVYARGGAYTEMDSYSDLGDDDPFMQGINFGVLSNETGGRLFYGRNDVNREVRQAETLGSEYYTLTYQPQAGKDDGRFRRIRVTLRNPKLQALTKTGYFGPDRNAAANPRQQTNFNLVEAAQSTIPMNALSLSIGGLVRHPDSRTISFNLNVLGRSLGWEETTKGAYAARLHVAAVSLDGSSHILTSKVETVDITGTAPDPAQFARYTSVLPLRLRIPRKFASLRVVAEAENGGRIGTVETTRKAIEQAPAEPTPKPLLVPRSGPARAPAGPTAP